MVSAVRLTLRRLSIALQLRMLYDMITDETLSAAQAEKIADDEMKSRAKMRIKFMVTTLCKGKQKPTNHQIGKNWMEMAKICTNL